MKRNFEKVVLAYSGGLDTSIIIPWLKENYGCRIIAVCADVGQEEDLEAIEEKAYTSGADKVYMEDLRREFVEDFIFPTLSAGAIYEGKYLLGTAIARPLIARRQAEIALAEGADALAHGCTGKGNDQVRFELTYKAVAPDLTVIAPWRIWNIRSRSDAIDYARAHGIPVPVTKDKPYSMDRNMWHISYEGGILEDPAKAPPRDMFKWTQDPEDAPDEPEHVEIDFVRGRPVAVNGTRLGPVDLLTRLNAIGARHGVGRVDIVENRLVGIKSRGVYETPGGTLLYTARRELEYLTLDRDTLHYKEMIAQKYAELVYYGQWYSTLRRALDAFVNKTQENLTGSVTLKLFKGSISVAGRKAVYSLYSESLATFEADDVYDHRDAAGFINLFGLPIKMEAQVQALKDGANSTQDTIADGDDDSGVTRAG